MACLECGQGFHNECEKQPCCCGGKIEVSEEEEPQRGNRGKTDEFLKDQQSTGRKRAALLYPLDRSAPCEWQGLKNCGGGEHPIIGCVNGLQQALHHGPDKNTLNNSRDNIHKLCHRCHNRFHTVTDPDYEWDGLHKPHMPVPATPEEQVENELYWQKRGKLKNVVD